MLPLVLMVLTTSGWSGDSLVTTADVPLFLVLLLVDPSV